MPEENRPEEGQQQEPGQAEKQQEGKSTVDKLVDKAQEKGWTEKAAQKAKDMFKGR